MIGKQSNPLDYNDPIGGGSGNDTSQPLGTPDRAAGGDSQPKEQGRKFRPKLIWVVVLSACSVLSGISSLTFWWLTTPPPSPDCQQLSPLATDMERLLCAQESARSGDLPKVLAGLELVANWTPDHPLYQEAQRSIESWSKPILEAAQARIEQSDLRGALELAERIPAHSSIYPEVKARMTEWRKDWQKGENLAIAARTAMKAQNWEVANQNIEALRNFPQEYWRYERVASLTNLLTAEQQGRRMLAAASQLANPQDRWQTQPMEQRLALAIAQLSQIDVRTYAWTVAQPSLKQWSETLLAQAWQRWQRGDFTTAKELATPVLKNPALAATAQELVWLSQAQQLRQASQTSLKPKLPQLWNLSAAIATGSLIPANSRYAATAQALLKNWQAQLQDLTLLQLAWTTGEVSHPWATQLALWQADQISRDRPRRTQAQTLVSYWQGVLQKVEDQPYLAYARQLAAQDTIAALNQAIAQAKWVTPARPSHADAQALINQWTQRIQALTDQPILDRAWSAANQGNLALAMQIASEIAPGRALYGQAQAAIAGWQGTLQAAEWARQRQREATSAPRPRPESELAPEFREPDLPEEFGSGDASPVPSPQETTPSAEFAPTPEIAVPTPANGYPPGTEPPPSQIPIAPPPAPGYLPYEPPPPVPTVPEELPPPPR